MAARLGIYWLKLAIIIVLPTGLILLDSHLFHLRGGEAFGYLALLLIASATSGIFQIASAYRALAQDRLILGLMLSLTTVVSVFVLPMALLTAHSSGRNFWSPVF